MANQDWLYRSAAPLYVAGKAANLSEAQQKQVNGLAWLSSIHKNLMKMDDNKAVEEYNKLDRKVQDSLKNIFGTSKYNPEEMGVLGTAAKYAKDVIGGVSEGLTWYGDRIDRPWRALMLLDDVSSFSEAWDKASDGKRLFDADREEQVNRFYDKETSSIAKRISMGDTIGEIISDLKTDQEFRTMEKFLAGDETVVRAIRDYDQAKISIGRSFAHLFNLNPDVGAKDQGVEGKVFNAVSGFTDLAYNVVADPLTWFFMPITAYRKASLGMTSLMRAEAGDLTRAQRAYTALTFGKKKFGWDAAFEKESVRKAWDEIGGLLVQASRRNKSTDDLQKAVARRKIQDIMPTLDDASIEELIKGKVTDADSALKFMKNTDAVMKIIVGKSGTREKILPAYTKTLEVRKAIRNGVNSITGVAKTATFDNAAFKGSFAETIASGQSAVGAAEVKSAASFGRFTAKMFERALIERSAYTGGFDAAGRSLRAKSAQSIYTLARTFLDKPQADIVAKMYIGAASEGQARDIIQGLYKTFLDASGVTATVDGKRAADNLMKKWNDQKFSVAGYLSDATAAVRGLKAGVYDPDMVDGQALANAAHHIKHQVELPQIADVYRIVNGENRWLSKTLGIRDINHVVTDIWSALNLLPRLGLRSVLDESLFHYLTMPVAVLQNSVRGYYGGAAQRMLSGVGGEKQVGFAARRVMLGLVKDLSPDDIKRIVREEDFAAQVLEEKLTKGVLGSTVFAGAKGKRYAQYLAEDIKYGYISQVRGLSEGMSRAVATSEPSASEKIATVLSFNPKLQKAMKKDGIVLGGKPTKINRADSAFAVNANMQLINSIDRNAQVGKIAVAYMEDPKKAVQEIAKYLRGPGKNFYKNFDRYNSKSTTVESDAFDMYVHVRMNLTNDLDEINKELLDKIRPNGFGSMDGTATGITIDDITRMQDGFRSEMFGFGKEVQVFRNFGDYLDEGINTMFYVMDRQIATLSREPAVHGYKFWYRDQFAASQRKYVQDQIKRGIDPKIAEDVAARKFAALANDFAISRVLGFVDNPHVRSNLAFSARNIARYYRANEDFYRRALRVLRSEGPQAVLRLRLANEGLDHAGFIHEDSQGDKYFTFPADEIMYNAYASILGPILGIELKRPMPLSLSGKIKMVTPSLDPESNLPTFSGPFISMAWSTFKNFLPEEHRDGATRALFGQYAEGQSFWSAIEPSTLKRIRTAAKAATGMEDDQISSATMKSMAYYAANGMAPGSDSTMAEREQFKYDVKATARSLVFLRNMLGLISPVSPQFATINDIPKELLDNGAVPLKQEFQRIVQAEYDKGNTDAWNTALLKWTKLNPGRLVYTVSEAEANTVAPIRKTREAVEWIQRNSDFAKKYREASVFFMPQASTFDLDAYAFLKREGYTQSKSVDKYFEEIANVVVENQFYDIKRRYEDIIDNTPSPSVAAAYRSEMDSQLAAIKESNPFLKRKFEQFDGSTQLKLDVVQNVQDALTSGMVPDNDTSRRIAKMVQIFNSGYANAKNIMSQTDFASAQRRTIKESTREELISIAGTNANAKLFYDVILKRLLD